MDMTRINDWLSAIPSPYTRKTYKAGIKKFEEFYGKGIETHRVKDWQKWI